MRSGGFLFMSGLACGAGFAEWLPMITTVIPYQQATLYQPAAPVPTKVKATVDSAPFATRPDSISLSADARARMAKDAAKNIDVADTADLKDAARKTVAALKRHQGREFTAKGIEITDPDTAMAGKPIVSLRAVVPQPVKITDLLA